MGACVKIYLVRSEVARALRDLGLGLQPRYAEALIRTVLERHQYEVEYVG